MRKYKDNPKHGKVSDTLIILVIVILAGIIGGKYLYGRVQYKKQQEKVLLALDYKGQNIAIPRKSGPRNVYEFSPYDAVDERELLIRLTAYNEDSKKDVPLTLNDVREYLSEEHNADGSLKIRKGHDKIYAYVAWYRSEGSEKVETYTNSIRNHLPQGILIDNLELNELKELIEKLQIEENGTENYE